MPLDRFENGEQSLYFCRALEDAFRDIEKLKQVVRFGLNQNLNVIAGDNNLRDSVFNLVEWAESNGELPQLIKSVYNPEYGNPGNQKLKEFCQQYSLSACTSTSRSQIIEKSAQQRSACSSASLSQPAPKPPQEQPQPKPTTQIILEDDLSSEKGVDYKRLRDLLKAGKWKEADEETLTVILKAAGREEEGYLNYSDIEEFPCTDLRTIDQLWVKYSNGHFGFSVQKRIWLECGGKIDSKTEKALGDAVGWRKKAGFLGGEFDWISYKDVTFSLDAPLGHLPVGMRVFVGVLVWRRMGLLSRRDL